MLRLSRVAPLACCAGQRERPKVPELCHLQKDRSAGGPFKQAVTEGRNGSGEGNGTRWTTSRLGGHSRNPGDYFSPGRCPEARVYAGLAGTGEPGTSTSFLRS